MYRSSKSLQREAAGVSISHVTRPEGGWLDGKGQRAAISARGVDK